MVKRIWNIFMILISLLFTITTAIFIIMLKLIGVIPDNYFIIGVVIVGIITLTINIFLLFRFKSKI